MDPITHGIAGSLLGKSFFTKREGRIATFACVLGAVFPDVDVFAELFSRDPLSVIRFHRGFTHSFAGLPIFAVTLAWLTRLVFRRRGAPSFGMLTVIYAVGLASHILLDATTSFGTRLWNPFSSDRVAWDLVFILDLSFSAIVLVPQVAAWIFRHRENAQRRAWLMWIVFNAATFGGWALAKSLNFTFHLWILAVVAAALAALFLLPLAGGVGFAISETTWCLTGTASMLVYIAACGVAHHVALARVEAFVAEKHINAVRIGAIPSPPSFLEWAGKIRTADGVYQARFDLRDSAPPTFQFVTDSPHDNYMTDAMDLPDARVYLWFARFPVIRSHIMGDDHVVDFSDSRFADPGTKLPEPFRLRFVLNPDGQLIDEEWTEGAAGLRARKIKDKIPEPGTK
ncbi:MAG: metal-dependent hydrolase [Candidatus Acidiferrales bacterium]